MNKSGAIWTGIGLAICALLVALCTAGLVVDLCYNDMGREAVQRGYAQWVIRPSEPGEPVWRWIEPEGEDDRARPSEDD